MAGTQGFNINTTRQTFRGRVRHSYRHSVRSICKYQEEYICIQTDRKETRSRYTQTDDSHRQMTDKQTTSCGSRRNIKHETLEYSHEYSKEADNRGPTSMFFLR